MAFAGYMTQGDMCAWSAPSHYLNQCWNINNWTLRNKLQWNLNQNLWIFIQENPFETVVQKMAAVFSRLQCVKFHFCFREVHFLFPQTVGYILWVAVHTNLTYWGRDKMDAISQTTFSNEFCWMKMYEYRLRFHWSLFPRVQLTHCGRVTHYGDGSMLCKNPIFFIMKEFPQI